MTIHWNQATAVTMPPRVHRATGFPRLLTIALATMTLMEAAASNPSAPTIKPCIEVRAVEAITDRRILPSTRLEGFPPDVGLSLRLTPGEFEPASFIVRATCDLVDLSIQVPSAVHSSGALIPNSHIDVKLVKVWYQAAGAWTSHLTKAGRGPELVPELLLNDDDLVRVNTDTQTNYLRLSFSDGERYVSVSTPATGQRREMPLTAAFPVRDAKVPQPFTLDKNQTKQVWITVKGPSDAPAGRYSGSIELSAGKSNLASIPIEIELLPFTLPAPRLTYSLYYRARLSADQGTVSAELRNASQLRSELDNMRDHGIRNPTIYQLNRDSRNERQLTTTEARELLSSYLDIRRQSGMADQPVYLVKVPGSSQNPAQLARLRNEVESLKADVLRHGGTGLYLYGIDEARGDRLTSQRKAWEAVHDAGAGVFAAGQHEHYRSMLDLTDIVVLHGPLRADDAINIHSAHRLVFSYHNPQSGPENPLPFRLNYGTALWRAGYDGAMVFAYQHAGNRGNIWNDFDSAPNRDHNLTYPTADGVVDTIAWEGLREGIDDVRYLSLLEEVLRHTGTPSSKSSSAALTDGHRLLRQIQSPDYPHDPATMRTQITDVLIQIQSGR